MIKLPLSKTNPYLKNAENREALFLACVVSSSAIEGINVFSPKRRKPTQKSAPAAAKTMPFCRQVHHPIFIATKVKPLEQQGINLPLQFTR